MFPQNLEKILWRILRLLKRLVITSYHIYVIPKSRWMITFGKWRKLSKYSHRKRPVAPHKIILLHSTGHWWKWKYSPFWMFMLTWHFQKIQPQPQNREIVLYEIHCFVWIFYIIFVVLSMRMTCVVLMYFWTSEHPKREKNRTKTKQNTFFSDTESTKWAKISLDLTFEFCTLRAIIVRAVCLRPNESHDLFILQNWKLKFFSQFILTIGRFEVEHSWERKRRWVKSELFCSNLTNLIIVILLHLSVSLRLFFSLILYYYCWFIRPWQHCPNVGPTFFYSTETQKSYQIIFHNASKQTERYSRLVIQQSVCIGTLCWAH